MPENIALNRRKRAAWAERERRRMFWWFASPWVFGLLAFTFFPLGLSLYLSFTEYNFSQPPVFVGLSNYIGLFSDPVFIKSVTLTVIYTVIFVPCAVALSLWIAVLLDGNSFVQRFTKILVYAPTTITSVVVGWLWLWILNPTYGVINNVLGWFHIAGPDWTMDQSWLMVGIVLLSLWSSTGTNMIIYLAALQNVPNSLKEAAGLDGANGWRVFRHVVFPLLGPVTIFVVINAIIGALQIFTPIFIMTGGGPNYDSEFYVLDLYQTAFQSFNFGKAAAMSWLLLIVFAVVTIWFFSYLSRHSYDELSQQ